MEPIDTVWWGGSILSDGTWAIWRRGDQRIEYEERDGYRLYIAGAYVESFDTFDEAAKRADGNEEA